MKPPKASCVLSCLLAACLVVFSQSASAQAMLSVQGTVQKSTGASVEDGEYTLTFKLYAEETGGTAVWSEKLDDVNITGGVYSVTLGSVNPLTAAFDKPYFLGITVGTSAELTPRARLTSSPYALSLIGQDNVFPSTGAVGIGTATRAAGYRLHINHASGEAKMLVEGTSGAAIDLKKGTSTTSIAYDGAKVNVDKLNVANLTTAAGSITAQKVKTDTLDLTNDLDLAANKSIVYNGLKDWRLVSIDDFENSSMNGWFATTTWNGTSDANTKKIETLLGSWGKVLHAGIADGALRREINLTGIPHTQVKVVFTYHFLDSWNGDDLALGGFTKSAKPATYSADNAIVSWRRQNEYYGYSVHYYGSSSYTETGTREEMVVKDSADKIWVFFSSITNDGLSNESFAIDDVEVWVR